MPRLLFSLLVALACLVSVAVLLGVEAYTIPAFIGLLVLTLAVVVVAFLRGRRG